MFLHSKYWPFFFQKNNIDNATQQTSLTQFKTGDVLQVYKVILSICLIFKNLCVFQLYWYKAHQVGHNYNNVKYIDIGLAVY